jgi:transposase-like protein
MDRKEFQAWLSAVDTLSEAQKAEAGEILSGRPAGDASLAAIELGVGDDRCCPHCGTPGAVANGKARGMQRYLCRACKRTFGALTGTRLSGLHRKEAWMTFGECLADGDTVKASAERCGVAVSTAFRWRHRFLEAIKTRVGKLRGIVEADETFVLASRKGDRVWKRAKEGKSAPSLPDRKARKRGGKAKKRGLSDEQVPVLVAADRSGATISAVLPAITADAIRAVLAPVLDKDALLVTDGNNSYPPCAAALGVSHEALNQSAGERVRGELHIQTVNNRHSRLKDFLRARRGIATRYLDSYLRWFHLIGLHPDPTARYCLAAAMGGVTVNTIHE